MLYLGGYKNIDPKIETTETKSSDSLVAVILLNGLILVTWGGRAKLGERF